MVQHQMSLIVNVQLSLLLEEFSFILLVSAENVLTRGGSNLALLFLR